MGPSQAAHGAQRAARRAARRSPVAAPPRPPPFPASRPSLPKQELARRGVKPEVAEEALRGVFGQGLDLGSHLDSLADAEVAAAGGGGGGGDSDSDSGGSSAGQLRGRDHSGGGHGGVASATGYVSVPHARASGAAAAAAAAASQGSMRAAELLGQARRQHALSAGLPQEARRRRLVGWLQRRGHGWEDISRLLRQLEKEEAARTIDAAASVDDP